MFAQNPNKENYYDYIGPFMKGYTAVKQNEKWGFVNARGDLIIPCIYDGVETNDFSPYFINGVVPVQRKNKWGAIDSAGKIIVPFEYDKIYSFRNYGMCTAIKNGKSGFINHKGEIILPLIYDEVWLIRYGFGKIALNGKTGYVDSTGKIIIECKYEDGYNPNEGLFAIKKEGKWGFIDYREKQIIPCLYEKVNRFYEGLASVTLNGKTGFINEKNEIVIPFEYDEGFYFFQNGFAGVLKNKKWGYINKLGKIIAPCEYKEYGWGNFEFETFVLKNDSNRYALFDSAGKKITDFEFEDISPYGKNKFVVKKNGKYGVINNKGKIVMPFDYEDLILIPETNYYFPPIYNTVKNGKMGYIDSTGKMILPFIYDHYEMFIGMFNDTLTSIRQNGIWHLINRKGDCITGCPENKKVELKFENGRIGTKGQIKNSLREGKWIYKNEKGKKSKTENYKSGIKDGVYKEWRNGKRYIFSYYKNDTLNGRYREYESTSGRKIFDYTYKDGKVIKREKIKSKNEYEELY